MIVGLPHDMGAPVRVLGEVIEHYLPIIEIGRGMLTSAGLTPATACIYLDPVPGSTTDSYMVKVCPRESLARAAESAGDVESAARVREVPLEGKITVVVRGPAPNHATLIVDLEKFTIQTDGVPAPGGRA